MTTNTGRASPSGPRKETRTTVSADVAQVNLATVKLITATVAGLRVTDDVMVESSALLAGLALGKAYCSAANTVTIPVINPTGGNIVQGVTAFSVTVIRFDS